MKRVLLDTNIYGRMVIDTDIETIKGAIRSAVIVYGCRLVRKGLRATSKSEYVGNHGLRASLLDLYDELASKTEYEITDEMKRIAESYYNAYREFGGSKSRDNIIDDFLIVACASVHEMDIVVSEDDKPMLTKNAIRAYKLVNKILKMRTPDFIGYEKFRRVLRGG